MKAKLIFALMALTCGPALAQNDVCLDANGNVDQTATQGWQGFAANANPQLMQQMVGVWYTEIPSPATGQTAYRYQTLEPNGLFTMQTRVCDSMNMCSDYPGHGFWAVQGGNGGAYTVMSIVSDTQVTNHCSLFQVIQPSPGILQDNMGTTWQRVQ